MLRSNNMARAVGRAFNPTYNRLEKAAIAAARRNDAMLLYVPDNPSNVLQFSAGYTPSLVGSPVGRLMDMQYGAPTLGPELLPATKFTDDFSGWASVLGTVSVVGGRLRTARGVATGGRAAAPISCIPGRTYRIAVDRYLGGVSSAGFVVAISPTSTVGNILSNYGPTGPYSATFIATQSSHWIALDTGTGSEGQYCEYDNVSVREVMEAPDSRGPELLINGTFSAWTGDNPDGWSLYFAESATEYVTQGFPGIRLVSAGAFNEIAQQSCVVGKTYEVIVNVSACTGTCAVSNGGATPIAFSGPGTYRGVFTAVNQAVGLKRNSGPSDFTITSLSLREVRGYHGFQITAANKPTLTSIPRKRGPELISPGAWTTGTPTSTTIVGSTITMAAQYAAAEQPATLRSGANYSLTYNVTAVSGVNPLALSSSGFTAATVLLPSSLGSNTVILQCVDATKPIRFIAPWSSTSITISDVSLREVLEWSNAVQLDGTDDWMDVTFRDYFVGGSYTFVGAWTGPVTGNSSFVLAQSNTSDVDPLCSPLFVPSGSNHVSIFERGDTAQVGISGSSYSLDTLQGSACVELLQTSGGGTGNYKGWRGGALVRNINYTRVVESLTTNKVTLGASQRTSVSGFAKGTFALLCWSANVMPDADRRAIGRFASYLIGEPYV